MTRKDSWSDIEWPKGRRPHRGQILAEKRYACSIVPQVRNTAFRYWRAMWRT